MVVKNVNSSQEFFFLLNNTSFYKYTLVDYTAKWCGPCNAIAPYVDKLSNEFPQVQFLKVDVDAHTDLSNWALVRGLPTFTVYKNTTKIGEVVGADKNALKNMLSKLP